MASYHLKCIIFDVEINSSVLRNQRVNWITQLLYGEWLLELKTV